MNATRWLVLICGALLGGAAGLYSARQVAMTAMPQLVSLFNAVGGGAAALIALADYQHDTHVSAGIAIAGVAGRADRRRDLLRLADRRGQAAGLLEPAGQLPRRAARCRPS